MIGVIASEQDHDVVTEFFQLFKTAWAFHVPGRHYPVILADREVEGGDAGLVIVFDSRPAGGHARDDDGSRVTGDAVMVKGQDTEIPIYRGVSVVKAEGAPILSRTQDGEIAGMTEERSGCRRVRIGYSLFAEIRFLLGSGQPSHLGHIPTLERHIDLIRDLMVASNIPVIEIPPVPAGYSYIACLTHDIDFLRFRDHLCDRTMAGFFYRASLGSALRLLQGRMTLRNAAKNVSALLKAPLVHLGLCGDFWEQIDAYTEIEKDWKSTFFLIPFKGKPGMPCGSESSDCRAAKYDVSDMGQLARSLAGRGFEVAVHGIDAWENGQSAAAERERLQECSEAPVAGIRMHWLYRDSGTFGILDRAGYLYDSTFGYNDAVGYRAGTAQAYKPLDSERLLELPLNIQDTALFYPDRMNLSEPEAETLCERLMENSRRYGGALTVLWHDRSLAPERLWGDFYKALLAKLLRDRAWIGPAGRGVQWFRRRRNVDIEWVKNGDTALEVRVNGPDPEEAEKGLPGLLLRVHYMAAKKDGAGGAKQHKMCMDLPLKVNTTTRVLIPEA
jgi:uncharacterized protein (UPF0248 family)